MQAAIYASWSKSKTIVVGKTKFSGLAGAHIENYCCMDGTRQGSDFLESACCSKCSQLNRVTKDNSANVSEVTESPSSVTC